MTEATTFHFFANIQGGGRIAIPKEELKKHNLSPEDHLRVTIQKIE